MNKWDIPVCVYFRAWRVSDALCATPCKASGSWILRYIFISTKGEGGTGRGERTGLGGLFEGSL